MFQIVVSNERQQQRLDHPGGPIELGRGPQREIDRLVIEDRYVSRDQLCVEEISKNRVRIENLGNPLAIPGNKTLTKGEVGEVELPVRLTVGYTTINIMGPTEEVEDPSLHTISRPLQSHAPEKSQQSIQTLGDAPTASTLTRWFETLLTVQRAAAGSNEFYQETAAAVVDLVGLDRGMVLLRKAGDWEVAASCSPDVTKSSGRGFSKSVLAQVVTKKRTFYRRIDEDAVEQSLMGVESVVASPIFDEQRQVIGSVYGSRSTRSTSSRQGILPLEAQVVQLLSAAVSTGLERVKREADALRNRVQFEQFCSPKLVQALERNPKLLDGNQREVTVMFCDLRGFSGIAEKLSPRQSYELLSDAMDLLTDEVIAYDGSIIDYYGDGLAAMWNAPEEQPEHAVLACRAALAARAKIPDLNSAWGDKIDTPLNVGIGINTGDALVGNAGSRRRMKYGPQGHTVNLASRVEGTTKVFHVPVLITAATRDQLPDTFETRRLRDVRVVNIGDAVALYELGVDDPHADWKQLRDQYERALSCFESGDWSGAQSVLQPLVNDAAQQSDVPAKLLLERVTSCLAKPPATFDPALNMKSK